MNRTVRRLAVPGVLVLGLGTAATAVEVVRQSIGPAEAQDRPPVAAAAAGPESLASAFRTASRAAFPSVVHVRVEQAARAVGDGYANPLEEMMGRGQMRRAPQRGSGSGFIISNDGYILTNNHVVEGATRVTVTLTDKREYTARVVGRDPNTDVAVLKIDAANLPAARIGESDALQTGDWVLALGYPLSLGETTTAGIVSAKGKSIGIMGQNEGANAPLEHFIQTDAVINPGNSGGPLIDLQGRVIGINSAIASPTGYYNGYGFAVPISLAKRVADDLIRFGSVHRPMIGVQIRDVTPADVEVFRLADAHGTVVSSEPSGPAAEAGIVMGDVITGIDGSRVMDTGELMERIARAQPGDRVTLDLVRYGDRKRVTVKLGTFASQPVAAAAAHRPAEGTVARLGFQAQQLDADVARQVRLPFTEGVIVTAVDPMGPAATSIPRGLKIERINGQQVRTLGDLRAATARLRPGQVVSIIGRGADGKQMIANYRVQE